MSYLAQDGNSAGGDTLGPQKAKSLFSLPLPSYQQCQDPVSLMASVQITWAKVCPALGLAHVPYRGLALRRIELKADIKLSAHANQLSYQRFFTSRLSLSPSSSLILPSSRPMKRAKKAPSAIPSQNGRGSNPSLFLARPNLKRCSSQAQFLIKPSQGESPIISLRRLPSSSSQRTS